MFDSIATVVHRRGWLIVLVWVGLTALIHWVAPSLHEVSRDDDVKFFPPGYRSVIGQDLLDRGFPGDAASSSIVILAERSDGPLTDADLTWIASISETIARRGVEKPDLGIKRVVNHRTPVIGPRLRARAIDGKGEAILTVVSLKSTYLSKQARLTVDDLMETLHAIHPPSGVRISLTGSAVVGHDINQASIRSIDNTTKATVALVVLILLVVYRSPLLALIPLLTIALSVFASLRSIALLTIVPGLNFQVINITEVFVVVVLFGAGTDYCLFLISRYREELARGRSYDDALSEAISKVGGALLASAGTVICGLGMLWFSSFAKIQYTGPAIALCLAIGLLAALTLAPILLSWLGGAVFWPFKPPQPSPDKADPADAASSVSTGLWLAVADHVVRRPALILGLSVAAMLPLAVIGARTQSNYSQLDDLGAGQTSVLGSQRIRHYFPIGELSPASILIHHPRIDFRSDTGFDAVAALSRKLNAVPNIAEVRSLSQPLGKPQARPAPAPTTPNPPSSTTPGASIFGGSTLQRIFRGDLRPLDEMLARNRYVSTETNVTEADRDHITRLELAFGIDPFSVDSLETLDRVRAVVEAELAPGRPFDGASAWGFAGATASINDLKTVTSQDERRMYWLVTFGVYAILVALIRRPWICLYLMVTVVLGYLASLGLTELVFRNFSAEAGHWAGLDWKVGFFLFVILVAVGEDYNIFLMSRVIEEQRKHGPVEGTRLAVAHTGGIISSCGLIMAGTFGSMLTGSLTALQELGFALAVGVLLDTFVVRPILVPAFLVLLHRGHLEEPPTDGLGATTDESPITQAEPATAT